MDVCLFILIPSIPTFSGVEFVEEIYYWNGVGYPQGKYHYQWGSDIKFEATEIPTYLNKYIPDGYFPDGFITLWLYPDTMDMWADELNGYEVEWSGFSLESFLDDLLACSKRWVFFFLEQCDQLDTLYTCSVSEFLQIMRNNLIWKHRDRAREGFIAIGGESFSAKPI
jgi:hypothetical protein